MRSFTELVTIGRVVKPQGRRGEVLAESVSDRPDRFPTLRKAYVAGAGGASREIEVLACRPHKGRYVLRLEGVETIDDAERYRGLEIRIPEEELEGLPPGSYYHHQLRGLRVEGPAGEVLGRVADLFETGAGAAVLVVRGTKGELLIPLADSFVKSVDLRGGRLVAVVPELVEHPRS